jgi:hypothetical protein
LLNDNKTNPVVSLDGGATFVPVVHISTFGNTELHPERKRELEAGADLELWRGRLVLTYSYYNTTRIDAIISIPLAPSVRADVTSLSATGPSSIFKNIGVVRNTGTELSLITQLLESRAVGWTVSGNLSANTNRVVRLNPGQPAIGGGTSRIVAGYPLWGTWALPIKTFADENHDNIIEPYEIRYGDSAVFVGQAEPKYQETLTTDVRVLNGRLGIHATFASQQGMTQINAGALNSGAFVLLPNAPGATLATQAGVVAASGGASKLAVMQTVNTFRFTDLSVNYELPTAITRQLRVPRATLALQGSNLGLHTNYHGKDPGVNVFATTSGNGTLGNGDLTFDAGQVPQPRLWRLVLSLGN